MSRQRAGEKVLASAEFRETIEDIGADIGANIVADYALIGGLAVAHYVNPPVTVDIDLLVDARFKSFYAAAKTVFRPRWRVTVFGFPMRGWSLGQPQHGVRLSREAPFPAVVDCLLTGADAFLASVVQRAKPITVQAQSGPQLKLRVITAEDLIIMKIMSAREKDDEDVQTLYAALWDNLDHEYIEAVLERLGWSDERRKS